MKNVRLVLSAVGVVLLTGCASTPVALAPVGPGPMEHAGIGSRGQLLVYSAWQGHFEGNNPTYYQHADYYIYNSRGKMIHHVYNAVGHYDPAPRLVPLPVGKYLVQSRAIDFGNLLVTVPVVIEPGETTRVHWTTVGKFPRAFPPRNWSAHPTGIPSAGGQTEVRTGRWHWALTPDSPPF